MEPLRRELDVFEEQREHLLREGRSGFVVILGENVVGTFDSRDEAYEAGLMASGLDTPFLLAPLDKPRRQEFVPAYVNGLLCARAR